MKVTPTVTVLIPHIPVRKKELERALSSIDKQTRPPDMTIVEIDNNHEGSEHTRNRALAKIESDYVAFLDDDDEFLPHHIDEILRCAIAHDADIVYPGCHVIGGFDPHDRFGQPFDPQLLWEKSYIPVTSLVKMDRVKELFDLYGSAFQRPVGSNYDDWGFYLRMLDIGAKFVHHPVKTWNWYHWIGNTSGMGNRWR